MLALRDGRDPLPLARISVKGRPGDPRAWSFLAESLPPQAHAEREAALRRAAELAPDNALALSALASELLEEGRSGEALPFARQAVRLSPFSATVLDTYASVSGDLGNCEQALLAAQRALDVVPEGSGGGEPQLRARVTAHLRAHREKCGASTSR
jgi:cytochrome c-type biogenesis protein CcmH/NrfG